MKLQKISLTDLIKELNVQFVVERCGQQEDNVMMVVAYITKYHLTRKRDIGKNLKK
jgi:hypothetical protein